MASASLNAPQSISAPFQSSQRTLSSHAQVARALGMEILRGTYATNENLPGEADLLARFQISRTVLREALKTLGAKGFIASKTRIGTRVTDPVNWNYFDADVLAWMVSLGLDDDFGRELVEIRLAVEPAAAALAAERGDVDGMARLNRALEAMRRTDTGMREFAEADVEFHLAVGAASGNRLMRSIAAVIRTALAASFAPTSPRDHHDIHHATVEAHAAIVVAIERGDAEAASDAMRRVIDAGVQRNRKAAAASRS